VHLEGLVSVEVEGEAGVWEEEVQAPEIEQVVAADLLGKGLDGTRVGHRVQQAHLQHTPHPLLMSGHANTPCARCPLGGEGQCLATAPCS
jgi:hypothetical protein